MRDVFKKFLFSRHILVNEAGATDGEWMETLVALAHFFGIEITEGAGLAQPQMIRLAQDMLGEDVPEPFYRGFPATVRGLTPELLLFDQLAHYLRTYGLGDFSRPGHSLLEFNPDMSGRELISALFAELNGDAETAARLLRPGPQARKALNEPGVRREFIIVTEEAALARLRESVNSLLQSTRPLSASQMELVSAFVRDCRFTPEACACKQTAIELMLDTMDPDFARFLSLPDVIDLADAMARRSELLPPKRYAEREPGVRALNLPNRYRRLLKQVIDGKFLEGAVRERDCYARQALWCALLHHIHYKPVNEAAEAFVRGIRSGVNRSPESEFEALLEREGPVAAAKALRRAQGSGAVLRRLDYLLSRCRDADGAPREDQLEGVFSCIETENALLLIQLLIRYATKQRGVSRVFRFIRGNRLQTHIETDEEAARRRTALPGETHERVIRLLKDNLGRVLCGRLGRVYIDPDMRRIALPLRESASMGGVGVLPGGSRLPLDLSKTVRGFTWWEQVDDIDLSLIGLDGQGRQTEFSWRTMSRRAAGDRSAVLFSGDQTAGYDGGSEYFDVDIAAFRQAYPDVRFLVFCDNIYSNAAFDSCFCMAGCMTRRDVDSGEVFEPKTVETAFRITGAGRFAYLFGIDLEKNELVWLNLLQGADAAVAGETSLAFLLDYMAITSVYNVYDFFKMMAREVVDDPADADVVVSDRPFSLPEGTEVIRSADQEKLIAFMNGGPL